MKLGLLAVVAASATLLLGAAAARPALDDPGFFVGFSEDLPRAIGQEAVTPARDLGARSFRFTLQWAPGQTQVAESDVVDLQEGVRDTAGMKVVLAVYSFGSKAPQTAVARDEYCAYVRDALSRLPSVRDVVIWNEPNKSLFWSPQLAGNGASSSPVAYEALLARCYDVLHEAFADMNVIGLALSPTGNDDASSHSPGAFIRAVGAAYRSSGRTRPLFDTIGHHAYGFTGSERPWRKHIGSKVISQGDWNKLMYNLWLAFDGTAQPLPGVGGVGIWYLEVRIADCDRRGEGSSVLGHGERDRHPGLHGRRGRRSGAGRDESRARPVHPGARQHQARGVPALRRRLLQLPPLRRAAARRLAVRRVLGGSDAQGFARRLSAGDHRRERRHGRLRRAQGRTPECRLHAAVDADRRRRYRAGRPAPCRGQLGRQRGRPEPGRLSRLPERRACRNHVCADVDEYERRTRDDVHLHRPGTRRRGKSRRRLVGRNGHDAGSVSRSSSAGSSPTGSSASAATVTAACAAPTAGLAAASASGRSTATAGSGAAAPGPDPGAPYPAGEGDE